MSIDYKRKKEYQDPDNLCEARIDMSPNVYHDGRVISWSIMQGEEEATIGCMSPGEYHFERGVRAERITILTGNAEVSVDGERWRALGPEDDFHVWFGQKAFTIRAVTPISYHCRYFATDPDEDGE